MEFRRADKGEPRVQYLQEEVKLRESWCGGFFFHCRNLALLKNVDGQELIG